VEKLATCQSDASASQQSNSVELSVVGTEKRSKLAGKFKMASGQRHEKLQIVANAIRVDCLSPNFPRLMLTNSLLVVMNFILHTKIQ